MWEYKHMDEKRASHRLLGVAGEIRLRMGQRLCCALDAVHAVRLTGLLWRRESSQ